MLGIVNSQVYDLGEVVSVADASPPKQSELMRILKAQAITAAERARAGDWNPNDPPYENWVTIIYDAGETPAAQMVDYLLYSELHEPISCLSH